MNDKNPWWLGPLVILMLMVFWFCIISVCIAADNCNKNPANRGKTVWECE